jgi:cytochrome P450
MTDEQVRDEAVGLLLGGNETTATALTWTAYLLTANEAVQEATHAEIDRVCAGAAPSSEHVALLGLTMANMQEAMRLYPPAYVLSRQATAEVEIGGYRLPRGAQVHLPVMLVQRDERWFDRAGQFVPQRFFDDGEKHFARGAYFPFGGGPRACIGRGFALFEGTLVLATILQQFHLRRDETAEPALEAQISLHPQGGLQVTLEPRR